MYRIFADDLIIYDDKSNLDNRILLNPVLNIKDNSAGSLSLTLPVSNIGYNTINKLTTTITVTKNGDEIWSGRVITEDKDFWNNRVLLCEGEFAYLNDTTQPTAKYANLTIAGFLGKLFEIHNAHADSSKQFAVGIVTMNLPETMGEWITNNEKTIECINKQLIEKYGGHLRVRKEDGIRYLDYLEESLNTSTQPIQFGKNLLDFTRSWDVSDYATVIVPLGCVLEETPIDGVDVRLSVAGVNGGSRYVFSQEAVDAYGWIEKVVTWDEVEDALELLSLANEYLTSIQFDNMVLEVHAYDLHYMSVDYEAFKFLDRIQIVSRPHGLDSYFTLTELSIPLLNPEDTTLVLGQTKKDALTSVTARNTSETAEKLDKINGKQKNMSEALSQTAQLLNHAINGFINIITTETGSESLIVSEVNDYLEAERYWVFNMNGIGYTSDGGETYSVAMTMDGSIVADFVNTGVLRSFNNRIVFDLDAGILYINDTDINESLGSLALSIDGLSELIETVSVAVEGKTTTYYSDIEPTTPGNGDIWYDTTLNKINRWDGTSWVDITSDALHEALSAAANAEAVADGKTTTYYATEEPESPSIGDIWYDTLFNKIKRWDGSVWADITDEALYDALSAAATAKEIAEGKTTTYYSDAAPGLPSENDIWYDTGSNKIKRYNNGSWSDITDVALHDALAAAADAEAIADSKIRTFVQATAPSGLIATDVGDLWINTSDSNTVYRWNGAAWVKYEDTRVNGLAKAQNANKVAFNNQGLTVYNNGLRILNSSNQAVFYADAYGNLTLSGTIYSSVGKIGGAVISSDSLMWTTRDGLSSVEIDGAELRLESTATGVYRYFLIAPNGGQVHMNCMLGINSPGGLWVADSGNKSKLIATENYGKRLLYCVESTTPYFTDIGEGALDENGECVVFIDEIFAETIEDWSGYQIFLTPYGNGSCYILQRNSLYFTVKGTPNLIFGWEIKAKQIWNGDERLEGYEPEEFDGIGEN